MSDEETKTATRLEDSLRRLMDNLSKLENEFAKLNKEIGQEQGKKFNRDSLRALPDLLKGNVPKAIYKVGKAAASAGLEGIGRSEREWNALLEELVRRGNAAQQAGARMLQEGTTSLGPSTGLGAGGGGGFGNFA